MYLSHSGPARLQGMMGISAVAGTNTHTMCTAWLQHPGTAVHHGIGPHGKSCLHPRREACGSASLQHANTRRLRHCRLQQQQRQKCNEPGISHILSA
jgi:hypothetical protein